MASPPGAPRRPLPGVKGSENAMERPDVEHVARFLSDAQNAEKASPLDLMVAAVESYLEGGEPYAA